MIEVVLLVAIIAAGTGGELCVARAMKQVGEVKVFRPAALLHAIATAMSIGWFWLGVALLAGDVCALLAMLSLENVSYVIPMTALSYVVGAIGGAVFLGERVVPERWIGVLLVCAGAALVFIGHG